jgi:hypothetical protein
MNDQPADPQEPDAEADLLREIRNGRRFSLAEAIGRMGGAGVMKGASPVAGLRAAQAEIAELVRSRLDDPAGSLTTVLVRHAVGDEALLRNLEQPQVAVQGTIRRVLANAELLGDLVRETDQEWGRVMQERPYFDRPGVPADPADPYTTESVRAALEGLLARIA